MATKRRTDKEIEEMYESGQFRVSQERNDFLIPQVVDFIKDKKWINIRPEYQRRLVWDGKKKSRFIESILMNVPVPPVFLYECEFSRYEVMDGQQRLNTIIDFYGNKLRLRGLERWSDLNGRYYDDCPPTIQRGFDRRRIGAVVLLAESKSFGSGQQDIRRLVFERLNTGALTLNAQELRNCLFAGLFNKLLIELAGHRLFDDIWGIPPYEDYIRRSHISKSLAKNHLFRRMTDCEIVLRFFAFRQRDRIAGSVRSILDKCMKDNLSITEEKRDELRSRFIEVLTLAKKVFGENVFRIKERGGRRKLSRALYDAVMVSLDRLYEQRDALLSNKRALTAALEEKLHDDDFYALIVGRPNTADAIRKRLEKTEAVFRKALKS